jgi:hypothetical protein
MQLPSALELEKSLIFRASGDSEASGEGFGDFAG